MYFYIQQMHISYVCERERKCALCLHAFFCNWHHLNYYEARVVRLWLAYNERCCHFNLNILCVLHNSSICVLTNMGIRAYGIFRVVNYSMEQICGVFFYCCLMLSPLFSQNTSKLRWPIDVTKISSVRFAIDLIRVDIEAMKWSSIIHFPEYL